MYVIASYFSNFANKKKPTQHICVFIVKIIKAIREDQYPVLIDSSPEAKNVQLGK